jgi:hypothetical protein
MVPMVQMPLPGSVTEGKVGAALHFLKDDAGLRRTLLPAPLDKFGVDNKSPSGVCDLWL